MRIGVVDLLSMPSRNWREAPYQLLLTKQYASIMPQAVAVWARRLGHEVHYTTYLGYGDPTTALPADLDVVFISCFTHVSPLAYALARYHRAAGALTVLGGPHARAFPGDCLRFFDLVVGHCDEQLIKDILAGDHPRHTAVAAEDGLVELPTVEERLPEIMRAAGVYGRRYFATTVPLLASVGCPYQCDFCLDWNNPYRLLPVDRLRADLAFLAKRLPQVRVTFHDPNFAAGWDQLLNLFEEVAPNRRSPTILESSLASLKNEERLRRIHDTRCLFIGVGLESWAGYSAKAGVGRVQGVAKVPLVVDELRLIADYVPYLQASFVFGLDVDQGDEPMQATKAFMDQAPFVWPAINTPQPFGNTPLHTQWAAEERLLPTMPFYFYQMPFLTTRPKHYDPMQYYRMMVELQTYATSPAMLRQRLRSTANPQVKLIHWIRTMAVRRSLAKFGRLLATWQQDRALVAFHRGETHRLPAAYEHHLQQALGRLSELLARADLTPLPPLVATSPTWAV